MVEDMWAKGEALEGNRHGRVASAPAWNLTVSSSTTEFAKCQEDFEDPPARAFEPWPTGMLEGALLRAATGPSASPFSHHWPS